MHTQLVEKTTGIAVVGAGRWGNHLVRNFLNHPNAGLLAVVDLHGNRLQSLGQRYQLASTQLVDANQWDTLLNREDIEAVAIATPASTHYELIKSALRHGKHVFVEKPITVDAKDAIELCELAHAMNRQLIVDHTYLFNAAVDAGQQWIKQRKLGPLRYGYATRTHLGPIRQDVDALWDLAIHDISIFSHWLQEFPCHVQANGKIWLQPIRKNHHANICNPMLFPRGLSDQVWVTLRYPSGIEVCIHLCWANPDKQRRLCLVGDQGTLIFDELHPQPLRAQPGLLQRDHYSFTPQTSEPISIPIEASEPLYSACDHFLKCVNNNQPSHISSGRLGAKFVETLQAITESLNQGGTPVFLNA
ncbi:MAG: Gfo/Idh/MocA family oxidoreductase [Cyanobacteria bacterium P01_F01_bin.150]